MMTIIIIHRIMPFAALFRIWVLVLLSRRYCNLVKYVRIYEIHIYWPLSRKSLRPSMSERFLKIMDVFYITDYGTSNMTCMCHCLKTVNSSWSHDDF